MGEVGRRPPRIGTLDGLTTGKRIQLLRAARAMSPTELAAAAKMSAQAVTKLESDGSNEPSYLNGLRIAAALGVTPWQLAGEPEPGPVATALPLEARLSAIEREYREGFAEMNRRLAALPIPPATLSPPAPAIATQRKRPRS